MCGTTEGDLLARHDLGGSERDRRVVDREGLVLVARVLRELPDDLAAPDLALGEGQTQVDRRESVGADRAGDDVAVGVLQLDRELAVREVGAVRVVDVHRRDRRDGDRRLGGRLRVVEHERRRLGAARQQVAGGELLADREVELPGLDVARRVARVREQGLRGAGEPADEEGSGGQAADDALARDDGLLRVGQWVPFLLMASFGHVFTLLGIEQRKSNFTHTKNVDNIANYNIKFILSQ